MGHSVCNLSKGILCEKSAGRPKKCYRDYVSQPTQGSKFEIQGPNDL